MLRPGSEAVRVELVRSPEGTGLVAVTVPSQMRSFLAPIPKDLYEPFSAVARAQGKVAQESGSPLPSWLVFNAANMTLAGKDLPDDALPLRVVLTLGGVRTVVVISKAAAR